VTALADGGFVTIWLSLDEVNSEWGIHARRYDSNGVEVGEQFRVNTSALVNQGLASVKALADGGFVVAWTSNGGLPSAAQVLGQRFGSDGIAVGSEFRINSNTTVDHSDVAVAGLSDGGFVAAWAASGQDGSLNGIYGQRFKTDGAAIGGEFRINTYTTGDQVHPALATMADGSFVVTWSSAGQDGDGFGIYGQRFASNGASVGTEFRVNTLTVGQQTYSSPAALLDGGFVVTWTSFDGNGAGIFGQRYGANGAATGAEFRINTYTNDSQTYASVTALSDGGFVVTWSSKGQDGSGYGIFGQRFTVDALPAGSEFRVNDITDGDQIAETYNGSETLATLGNGRLVQVWSGLGSEEVFFTLIDVPAPVFTSGMTGSIAENAPTSVVAYDADATSDGPITYSLSGVDSELFAIDPDNGQVRFLASPNFEAPADKGANNVYDIVVHARDGLIETTRPVAITVTDQSAVAGMTPVPLAGDVQANSYTPGVQAEAAVTSLSDGGFVVTWTSFDGNGAGISGQRYAESGIAVGSEFKVNTYTTSEQTHSSVTSLSDGGFVVTWSSRGQDGSGYGVYGQRYAEDGIAVGNEFKVNTTTTGDQFYSPVASLPDGSFVVTWMSLNQDGTSNIYGQRYAQNGSPAGSEFKVNTYTGGSPREPAATSLSDGGFLVTWTSFGQDGSAGGVYGQRYGADGTAHGGEFKVNSYTTNTQSNSSATSLPDGGFVVTWSSLDQDHSGYGIYGQRYAANGSQVGGEFKANTETGSDQRYSSVTSLHDGGFVVSWTSLLQDGSGSGVYGQRYAADGTSMGGEFRLNQITAGDQGNVTLYGTERVTSLNDGHFVQVWSGTGTTEVFFRRVEVPWGDDNAAPTITSDGGQGTASLSVAENTKGVTTVVANDTDDGQTLTYSLAGGADAAAFAIDGKSGALSFVAAPNFEALADANKDNVYEVVVKASDGAGGSDSQAIGVTVTNVNTAPTITSGAAGTVAENAPVATVVYDAEAKDDGENSGTLTYSLAASGDSKLFNIDAGTGQVTFKAQVDFDKPGDADGNNVYEITVQASDGSLVGSQPVSITVTDQNDMAPTITTEAALSVPEGTKPIVVLTSTDPDIVGANPVFYSISGGADGALFEIIDGSLEFAAGRDYETEAHSYQVEVTASDGVNESAKLLTITLTDQNDTAPEITTEAALSVAENTLVVAALTSTDVDTVGTAPAEFSVSGGVDADLFDVASGNLVFKKAPDFETDPHSYQVEVKASDGVNHSVKLLTVTLTDLSGVTITGTGDGDTVNATTTVPGQPLPTQEDDVIKGLAGNDSLSGLGGNDRLDGGTGAEAMSGGPGNDTYVVDDAGDAVTELANEGIDTVEASVSYTLGSNVERLTLSGDQAIDGHGNSLANQMTGNEMANVLDGGAGQDTMTGLGGNDTYVVDDQADAIIEVGNGGIDLVISSAFLFTLPVEVENLTLAMGAGDTFGVGNGLANTLVGNGGVNTLIGNAGADTLDGGAGADYLLGGAGNDLYKVDDTFDLVDEGGAFPAYAGSATDFDTISSTAEWFWDVYSVGERLQIEEGAVGSDGAGTTIVGSVFSNDMIGNSGNNIMFGRGGADIYRAGDGVDWISLSLLGVTEQNAYVGVDGVNTIIVDKRTTGASSFDIIVEFEAGKDKIDVSSYGYTNATEVMQHGHDDGLGNSYYALGDGRDYVYLVGVSTSQVHSTDFVV